MEINKTPWCMSIEFKKCETTENGWLTYSKPKNPKKADGITVVKEFYNQNQILAQASEDKNHHKHGNHIRWNMFTGKLQEIFGYAHGSMRSYEVYDEDGLGKLIQRTELGADGTTNGEQFVRLAGGRFELTTYKEGARQGERITYDPKKEELLVEEYKDDEVVRAETLRKAKENIYDALHITHPRDKAIAEILKNA